VALSLPLRSVRSEPAGAYGSVRTCTEALRRRGVPADGLPFLQHFNLWRTVPAVREVATSPELCRAAADLMGVRGVRLYQDALFHKRGGGDGGGGNTVDGPTPWHIG